MRQANKLNFTFITQKAKGVRCMRILSLLACYKLQICTLTYLKINSEHLISNSFINVQLSVIMLHRELGSAIKH